MSNFDRGRSKPVCSCLNTGRSSSLRMREVLFPQGPSAPFDAIDFRTSCSDSPGVAYPIMVSEERNHEEGTMRQLRLSVFPQPSIKNQHCCGKVECQRARKAAWQRQRLATDPDYQADKRDSQKAWLDRNPTAAAFVLPARPS